MTEDEVKKRNFVSRVQRNPFMKQSVLDRLHGCCWFCGKPLSLDELVLHHLRYDLSCEYACTIKIPYATPKRPNGSRKVPDCETCFNKDKARFYLCEIRLVAVHDGCHFLIHRDEIFSKRKT